MIDRLRTLARIWTDIRGKRMRRFKTFSFDPDNTPLLPAHQWMQLLQWLPAVVGNGSGILPPHLTKVHLSFTDLVVLLLYSQFEHVCTIAGVLSFKLYDYFDFRHSIPLCMHSLRPASCGKWVTPVSMDSWRLQLGVHMHASCTLGVS